MIYKPKDCKACDEALFCSPCIQNVLDTDEDPKCPSCHKNEGFRELHKRLAKHLNETKVCCNKEYCPKKGEMETYETFVLKHPEECV